jgi:hypothetical protein
VFQSALTLVLLGVLAAVVVSLTRDPPTPGQLGKPLSMSQALNPSGAGPGSSLHAGAADKRAAAAYQKLPLSFIPNAGQTDRSVRYYAQGAGFGFYFTKDKAVLAFPKGKRGVALDLRFLGANPNVKLQAQRRGPGTVNYLLGVHHHTGLPTYRQVSYRELWPGIDMVFRGSGRRLKYEFLVHPGAHVSDIRLAYAGAESLSVDAGKLLIQTPLGVLNDARPHSYQQIGGRERAVDSRFSLARRAGRKNEYGFRISGYDRHKPLMIDPGIAYSTFLGGASDDLGTAIAVDGNGNAYVAGTTLSTDFPTTPGAYDVTPGGTNGDAFVTKLNASGSSLVYSTFLAGSTGGTDAGGIVLDSQGNAYVTGRTSSTDFPTTPGAYDTSYNGGDGDVFVTKLNAAGSGLLYSTLLGGALTEGANGIALDGQGDAYVAGTAFSTDFPTTAGAFQTTFGGNSDAFVTKLNAAGSGLLYSTFVGGADYDFANGLALDGSGSAYVSGLTDGGFPVTPGAYDTTFNAGFSDAFVAKLDAGGSSLAYSTYLGGSDQETSFAIGVDGQGSAYVTGLTASQDFPATPGAADTSYNGFEEAYVTKLNVAGSGLAYSTFLGGGSDDAGHGIFVDAPGNAYVTGWTFSTNFPTTPDGFDTSYSGSLADAFLTRVSPTGSSFIYSTYLGGSQTVGANYYEEGNAVVVDPAGSAYIAGNTPSADFPTTPGAYDTTYNSTGTTVDTFVTKLTGVGHPPYEVPESAPTIAVSIVPAFTPCGTPGNPSNAMHSPPLAVASCNPPQPGGVARIGSQATLSAELSAVPGDANPSNGNQADLAITANLTDITTSGGLDYTPNSSGPDMTLYARLRFTDLNNGLSGNDPGTAADLDFSVPLDCAATPNPNRGSTCSANTSADTVTPGAVKEDRSTILQTFRLRVNDSGANGIRGDSDDRIFATQGVFVP